MAAADVKTPGPSVGMSIFLPGFARFVIVLRSAYDAHMLKRNIELKARCVDLERARRAAESLGATFSGILDQCDTYFAAPHGRLKLRETAGLPAELIWYERPNDVESRASDYRLVRVDDARGLRDALTAALGGREVVRKRRELWLWENVRIHLDAVEGLGTFVEFEAVMTDGDDDAAGHAKLAKLRAALGIGEGDLIASSYADLGKIGFLR
jgi:adenylate cyclase class 2